MINLINWTYHLRFWKGLSVLIVLSCYVVGSMARPQAERTYQVEWADFENDLVRLEKHLLELDQDPKLSGENMSELLRGGYEYFSKSLHAEGQALMLNRMGILYARESMLSAAIDVHEQALEIYSALELDEKKAQVQMLLGTNFGRRGDYDQATSHLLESLT